MENDSIRASGSDTLVDIWINGKLRAICVTREAIDAFVGLNRAAGMSDEDRCEFVRARLPLVVTAVKTRLAETSPGADTVVIDAGHLPGPDGSTAGDRRKGERRKTDRRKVDRPKESLPHGERRRGDRRKSERRRRPSKSS
jgi:hypothetical protein